MIHNEEEVSFRNLYFYCNFSSKFCKLCWGLSSECINIWKVHSVMQFCSLFSLPMYNCMLVTLYFCHTDNYFTQVLDEPLIQMFTRDLIWNWTVGCDPPFTTLECHNKNFSNSRIWLNSSWINQNQQVQKMKKNGIKILKYGRNIIIQYGQQRPHL